MAPMNILVQGSPTEDDAAAIIAAISCVLEQEAVAQEVKQPRRSAWRAAALLEAQGLPSARTADAASWPTVRRAERARHWSKGIV